MKTVAVRLIVGGLPILVGSGSIVADTSPVPLCYPKPCSTN